MSELKRIKECFCGFIGGILADRDLKAFEYFSEDVMSIGMGNQGVVSCKQELYDTIMGIQKNPDSIIDTSIKYSHMQIRYYGDDYASINAVISVSTTVGGEVNTTQMGQCASMRKINGDWKVIMLQATPISMELDELDAYPLAFAEEEIENYRAQQLFSKFRRQNMIAFYKVDVTDNIVEGYKSFKEHRYSYAPEIGSPYEKELYRSIVDRLEGDTRQEFVKTFSVSNLTRLFRAGQSEISMEYEASQPGADRIWLLTDVYIFIGSGDHLKAYFYLVDIDEEKKRKLDLEYRAEMDIMTGLYNKSVTSQKIAALINTPLPCNQGAFLILDIDDFKRINDTFGHAIGDDVIRKIACILKDVFGNKNIVGRIGGDEFCVFYMENFVDDTFLEKLNRILKLVRNIQIADCSITPTVSIGVVRRSKENFEEIFRKADKALYMRKQEYDKDGYTFYK